MCLNKHTNVFALLATYKEWYQVVTDDITRELKAGRAIFVVFKDQSLLERFATEIKMTGLKVTYVCRHACIYSCVYVHAWVYTHRVCNIFTHSGGVYTHAYIAHLYIHIYAL
jgi:hypothetical protein